MRIKVEYSHPGRSTIIEINDDWMEIEQLYYKDSNDNEAHIDKIHLSRSEFRELYRLLDVYDTRQT